MDITNEYYSQAQLAFLKGQYTQAIELAEKEIELDPRKVECYTLLGNVFLVQNRFKESEKCFKKAVELAKDEGERYFDYGNSLFGQERISEAIEMYAEALKLRCSNQVMQKIYYIMGLVNHSNGEFDDALSNFDRAESLPGLSKDAADILLIRIQIYLSQNRMEEAENCAIRLKLLEPKEFKSYQLLFQIYVSLGEISKAKEAIAEAQRYCDDSLEMRVETEFDNAMILCKEAERSENHSIYKQALTYLENVEKMDGVSSADKSEAIITRAEILIKIGNYKTALSLAENLASLNNPDLKEYIERAYYIIIMSAEKDNNFIKVKEYATKLKNSDNLFYKHYGFYNETYALKKLSEKDSSLDREVSRAYDILIAYYKNCTIYTPSDFVAYFFRAKAYIDIRKFDEALKIMEILPEESQKTLQEYLEINR